ncbi:MAG: thioredoxin family protein [Bacteroidetes bacterium]|nr:thioredoxin family protein [Bacteroidota bacterium]
MKILLASALLAICPLLATAQLPGAAAPAAIDPVKWSISTKQVDARTWDILFRGDIEHGWYVYSQESFGDMGPLPTVFAFDTLAHVTLQGRPSETGAQVLEGVDPVFDMKVKKFKGHALFTQRVVTDAPDKPITGRFDYQTCDDKACIFPDPVYFSVMLSQGAGDLGSLPFPKGGKAKPGIEEPVTWAVLSEDLGGGRWKLSFDATVQEGWYIYSQESFGDGPIPTSIAFDTLAHAQAAGKPTETGPEKVEGLDEMFGINVRKYKHRATFMQEVVVTDVTKDITGVINYMSCDNTKCIFPEPLTFSVNLASGAVTVGDRPVSGMPTGAGCDLKLAKVDLDNPVLRATGEEGTATQVRNSGSLWSIFFLGFLGGLLALLTPCVFPMIPLTVSFFTKGSEDRAKGMRNALTYGGFILAIYLLFSLPFHLLGSVNPEIFNEISTNPWLNIFFFVIFLVFAVSFFGYFEITLPSSWVNKMDSNASRFGGWIGIFFMALTLALVSFSCTGPILGSLLAGALTADGGAWQLTVGMGAFGLALALPFALFAMFPGWLNSLPRSGSWLNSVKVVLGFAEVALAFKFLSNADLVKHWRIVPYELFMIVWIICGAGIVLYLLGIIRFPHDSPVKRIAPLRWGFIGVFAAFTVYMCFGFRYNEEARTFSVLKLMSGLAPPVGYSWIHPKECPSRLDCYHDLDAALAQAKTTGKPILVDFTGYACVNCRKMEEHVWPVPAVHSLIDKDYVLVSLYVDDKEELPTTEQRDYTTCTGKQKRLVTKGNKWSTLQTETFVNNSQPYYVLLSPDGELLTDPVPYTPDADEYQAFLQRGLEAMRVLDLRASK